MKNYEDWAQLIAKNLAHEADYIAAIDKDELDDKAATEAFVRAVLEPFLPENSRLFRILCQRKNTRSIRSQIECSIKPAFKEDGQLR